MFWRIFSKVLLGGECVQLLTNCVNVPSFLSQLVSNVSDANPNDPVLVKQGMKWSVHKTKWHLKRNF